MTCKNLNKKQSFFLYKCILRHFKEYGKIKYFKKDLRFKSFKTFYEDISRNAGFEIHEYLVGVLWACYKASCVNDANAEFSSSVFYLNFIDLLNKNKDFKLVCQKMANSELSFIDNRVKAISFAMMTKKTKNEINEALKKYSYLLNNNVELKHIPFK